MSALLEVADLATHFVQGGGFLGGPTKVLRAVDGVSLTLRAGETLGLVGESGCGKSTTIQLVERFYDPLVGTVYLDEQPISELNVTEYRKHIALVSQEPVSVLPSYSG